MDLIIGLENNIFCASKKYLDNSQKKNIEEGSLYWDTLIRNIRALLWVQIIHFMRAMLLKPFRVEKRLGSKSPNV